jgi:hypothetical protein
MELVASKEIFSIISEQRLLAVYDHIAKYIWCHVLKGFREQIIDFHDRILVNWTTCPTQSPSCLLQGLYSTQ